MEGGEPARSLEHTPTWVLAVVCLGIVFISVCAERGLDKLGKWFQRNNQDELFESLQKAQGGLSWTVVSLQKVKQELMLLGFISLLLAVFQGTIIKFCIPHHLSIVMLPCKIKTPHNQSPKSGRRPLAEEVAQHCSPGHVPFLYLEALHDLHIFIFVLAAFYVISSASAMLLEGIRIREWRQWERSIRGEPSGADDHAHMQEFMGRTYKYWRSSLIVSWMVAFFKQFHGSVTKSDYIALRSKFIRENRPSNPNYDFHKHMMRALEKYFQKTIGISWYLWFFAVAFLLTNIAGWHPFFWASFLPLILLLIVGTKLEHIITQIAKEAAEREAYVMPSDEFFWFRRPTLVLYLIHFILFQNSFGIAYSIWIWSTYGFRSCMTKHWHFIVPRLIIAVLVHVLCSYSTLPVYALVTQMGSIFKPTDFDETNELLRYWASGRRHGSTITQPGQSI